MALLEPNESAFVPGRSTRNETSWTEKTRVLLEGGEDLFLETTEGAAAGPIPSRDFVRISLTHDVRTACAITSRALYVWDAYSGELLHSLSPRLCKGPAAADTASWRDAAVSTDRQSAAIGNVNYGGVPALELWDIEAAECRCRLEDAGGRFFPILISEDGSLVTCGSGDGVVRVWDSSSGELVHRLEVAPNVDLGYIAISSDRSLIAIGGDNWFVSVWDLVSGKRITELPESSAIGLTAMIFSPVMDQLVTAGTETPTLRHWDFSSGSLIASDPSVTMVGWQLAWSPDGSILAILKSHEIVLVDPGDTNLCTLQAPAMLSAARFLSTGQRLTVAGDFRRNCSLPPNPALRCWNLAELGGLYADASIYPDVATTVPDWQCAACGRTLLQQSERTTRDFLAYRLEDRSIRCRSCALNFCVECATKAGLVAGRGGFICPRCDADLTLLGRQT